MSVEGNSQTLLGKGMILHVCFQYASSLFSETFLVSLFLMNLFKLVMPLHVICSSPGVGDITFMYEFCTNRFT